MVQGGDPTPDEPMSDEEHDKNRLTAELQRYNSIKAINLESNPLVWWSNNCSSYPLLSKMALRYLSCPPSSVESERLFSHGGNVITTNRARLGPEFSSRLIFSNFNMLFLPKLKYC